MTDPARPKEPTVSKQIVRMAARDIKPGMEALHTIDEADIIAVRSEALTFEQSMAQHGSDWVIEWSDGEIEYVWSTTVTNMWVEA